MVIFTVLKILLIIILAIAGLIIVLIGLVLFWPLRYSADISFIDETLDAGFELRWFFSLMKAYAGYHRDTGLSAGVRLFHRLIYDPLGSHDDSEKISGDKGSDKKHDKSADISTDDEKKDLINADIPEKELRSQTAKHQSDSLHSYTVPSENAGNVTEAAISNDNGTADGSEKIRKDFFSEVKKRLTDAYIFVRALYRAAKDKTDRLRLLYELWNDEKYTDAEELLKKKLFGILRELSPVKGNGHIEFGSGDPYSTGMVMEAAAIFYPLYCSWLEIVPVFDESVLAAELHIKGRIRLFFIIEPAARIYFNKKLRYMYKKARKILDIE